MGEPAGRHGSAATPALSIQLPNFSDGARDWRPVLALARDADAAGIDRLVVSDHVLFGERLEAYAEPDLGGIAGGRQPTGPDGHWLEPLTLLAMVAGVTETVRLGTAILLAALRPPTVLAKQAATLDVLSGGRLDLGVGVGWQREEYEAGGLVFSSRGALLDRTLALCQRLWTEEVVEAADERGRFDRVHAMPKPLQHGGVPIWISGRMRRRTIERVCRFGSGWIPWGDDASDPRPGIAQLREALEKAGRDPAELQVQGTLPVVRSGKSINFEATMAGVPPLVAAGVTDFRLHGRWLADPAADRAVLSEAVAAFRRVVG